MQTKTNFKKKRTAPLCEPINPEEYTAKLSKLLDQISAQNNYSNRILVTNVRLRPRRSTTSRDSSWLTQN